MKRQLGAVFTIAVVVGAWFLVGPTQLGGSVSYVVTSGDSMEPSLHDGDLVLVRDRSDYGAGDAVAYLDAELGSPVLHRIVETTPDGFVLQGDNNDFIDTYKPTGDEIIGESWFVIPSGGDVLRSLTSPWGAAAVAAVLGLGLPGAKFLRRRPNRDRYEVDSQGGLRAPTGGYRRAAAPLATVAGLSLLLTVFAFRAPTSVEVSDDLTMRHEGRFSYTDPDPAGSGSVYGRDGLQTGEPVYPRVTDEILVTFDHVLEGDSSEGWTSSGSMEVVLSAPDGWSEVLTEVAEESGSTVGSLVASISMDEIRRKVDRLEAATGSAAGIYTVEVRPTIGVAGTVAGEAQDHEFQPVLGFTYDRARMLPSQVNLDADVASSFGPTEEFVVDSVSSQANSLSLLGVDIDVSTARTIGLVSLMLVAVVIAFVGAGFVRARRQEDEALGLLSRYGDICLPVSSLAALEQLPAIEVPTFEALVRLAEAREALILYVPVEPVTTFVVEQAGAAYFYEIAGSNALVDDDTTGAPVLTIDLNEAHVR